MPDHKHKESIEGGAKPADIFQPYLQGVELFEDIDLVFQEAGQLAAGQHSNADTPELDQAKRGVAIVTPGRLMIDLLVHKAGWRWYNSFKTTRTLKLRVPLPHGKARDYSFTVTLTKSIAGKRQLRLER